MNWYKNPFKPERGQHKMNTMSFTDNHPMPFGKHKGTLMANVPAQYLIWLWMNSTEHDRRNGYNKGVLQYIEANLERLKKEVERERANKKYGDK